MNATATNSVRRVAWLLPPVGSSNVNSTTGAWSVTANNSRIMPATPNWVRVTSAKGTVLIIGGGS